MGAKAEPGGPPPLKLRRTTFAWLANRPPSRFALRRTSSWLASRSSLMIARERRLVRPAGLEPATPGLGNRCSILLSYGRM